MDEGVVVLRLVDGHLAPESWVYAVVARSGDVLHVGSTTLPPAVRTWLHLEHEDADVGRLRSAVDPDRLRDAVVVAVAVPVVVDRQAVRELARGRLTSAEPGRVSGPPEERRVCDQLVAAVSAV